MNHCFASTVHYRNCIYLPRVVECHHLAPTPQDAIIPIAFSFPNSVAVALTVSSGLQGTGITELFKNIGAPLTHSFPIVVGKAPRAGK